VNRAVALVKGADSDVRHGCSLSSSPDRAEGQTTHEMTLDQHADNNRWRKRRRRLRAAIRHFDQPHRASKTITHEVSAGRQRALFFDDAKAFIVSIWRNFTSRCDGYQNFRELRAMIDGVAATLQTKTMLRATVDFDKPGKQTGFIQVPHSVHDDAWGVIRVPIAVISNGAGQR
jgi:hypothetical protein